MVEVEEKVEKEKEGESDDDDALKFNIPEFGLGPPQCILLLRIIFYIVYLINLD